MAYRLHCPLDEVEGPGIVWRAHPVDHGEAHYPNAAGNVTNINLLRQQVVWYQYAINQFSGQDFKNLYPVDPETRASENGIILTQMAQIKILFHNVSTILKN
jgi:hypothetical protein